LEGYAWQSTLEVQIINNTYSPIKLIHEYRYLLSDSRKITLSYCPNGTLKKRITSIVRWNGATAIKCQHYDSQSQPVCNKEIIRDDSPIYMLDIYPYFAGEQETVVSDVTDPSGEYALKNEDVESDDIGQRINLSSDVPSLLPSSSPSSQSLPSFEQSNSTKKTSLKLELSSMMGSLFSILSMIKRRLSTPTQSVFQLQNRVIEIHQMDDVSTLGECSVYMESERQLPPAE